MKKKRSILVILCGIILFALSGCAMHEKNISPKSKKNISSKSEKLQVVATIFPEYDFLRQIAGKYIDLSLLLPPGAECHSYEPTPKDMIRIQNADVFVYVGGDSDAWVTNILSSVSQQNMKIVTLMDCVRLYEEEEVDGMTPEKKNIFSQTDSQEKKSSEEKEYDEHVWTSPKNAIKITEKLCLALSEKDPKHASVYRKKTNIYQKKLKRLDSQFRYVVQHSQRKEIIVADRFPFRYFVQEYGLHYCAAFPGCSADTEPNAATIAYLIKKVKTDKIPVVFHIELSNEKMCDMICQETGAKKELLNAVHNIRKKDFQAGTTYLDLMEHNVKVLKQALS